MTRSFPFACALALALGLTSSVQAWNKAGHMLTGAIAFQVLQQDKDDKTIARVVALLQHHPEAGRWNKFRQMLPKADRELYLFMQAARWPDDARDDPEFYPPNADYDKLHYINFPYKPNGQPASVKTRAPDNLNIFRGYADKLGIVNSKAKDADRAIALCWLVHLIGDVHQPLHTTSLFSTKFKNGDRGGTLFFIRAKEGKSPISLHKYWDDLLLSSQNLQDVKNYAIELRSRKEFAREKLTELASTNFQDWAVKESVEIAKEVAYRNGKLDGGTQQAKAPALPEDYPTVAQPVAERRAVLAGYRMATTLRKSFE